MDVTPNRSYPYPQCAPPLVEDSVNAPVQTRLLAETMAADFDTVSSSITDTYQIPTTIIRLTIPTLIYSDDPIPFDKVEYDPQGLAVLPGVTLAESGIYLLTGFAHSDLSTDVESLNISFTANGQGFHRAGTSPPVTDFGRMTASSVTLRTAGDVMGMSVTYGGTASNFFNAWFGVARLVKT